MKYGFLDGIVFKIFILLKFNREVKRGLFKRTNPFVFFKTPIDVGQSIGHSGSRLIFGIMIVKMKKFLIALVPIAAIILAFCLLWSVVDWKEVLTSLIGSIVFALIAYATARRWENITAEKRRLEREIEFDRECLLKWRMFLAQNDGFKKQGVKDHHQNPALRHLQYMFDRNIRPYQHSEIRQQLPLDKIIKLDPGNFADNKAEK